MHIQTIYRALETLDPENDDHWTSDGAPRLDVLEPLLPAVTRAHLLKAAPLFNRKHPELPDLAAEREKAEELAREAKEADIVAADKRKAAESAKRVVENREIEIRDRHTLTRQNQAWVKSQLEADKMRALHQQQIDQALRNAGGQNNAGPHPIDRNTAIRNRAARKNIVIQTKKTA